VDTAAPFESSTKKPRSRNARDGQWRTTMMKTDAP
jgi:hypothetical protein